MKKCWQLQILDFPKFLSSGMAGMKSLGEKLLEIWLTIMGMQTKTWPRGASVLINHVKPTAQNAGKQDRFLQIVLCMCNGTGLQTAK